MKQRLLKLLLGFMILPLMTVTASQENQKTEQSEKSEKLVKLNAVLKQQYAHLNSLNDILQYLAQSIRKGSIKVKEEEKDGISNWILSLHPFISELELELSKNPEDINDFESNLYYIAQNISSLTLDVKTFVASDLKILNLFNKHTKVKSAIDYDDLSKLVITNTLELNKLKNDANNVGLSWLNRFTRKIDYFNNRFSIKDVITTAGGLAFFGIGLVYLWPVDLFPNWNWLREIKLWVGRRPTSQEINGTNTTNGNAAPAQTPAAPALPPFVPAAGMAAAPAMAPAAPAGPPAAPALPVIPIIPVAPPVPAGVAANNIISLDTMTLKLLGKFEQYVGNKETLTAIGFVGAVAGYTLGEKLKAFSSNVSDAFSDWWQKLKGFEVRNSELRREVIEDFTLDDKKLIGSDEAKEKLKKLVNFFTEPEVFNRSDSGPTKTVLLIGESGCGKTEFAKALSGSVNKKLKEKGKTGKFGFIEIRPNEIYGSSNGIQTVMERVKKHAPCFIFLDEFHLYSVQAIGASPVLAQFLTALSGFNVQSDTDSQIILVAATNRPDKLEPALLRTGRFGDNIIEFTKPSFDLRKTYFKVTLEQNGINTTNIDIDSLIKQTENCPFSDLYSIIKSAKFEARLLAQGVSQKHLQDVTNTLVHRFKINHTYTDQEKNSVAARFAGISLLYCLPETSCQEKLQMVTINAVYKKIKEALFFDDKNTRDQYKEERRIECGSVITYHPNESSDFQTPEDILNLAKIKLAGAAAERILLGKESNQNNDNRVKAFNLIHNSLLRGMPINNLSKKKQNELSDRAHAMLEKYESEVEALLKKYEKSLRAISQELLKNNTLFADQIVKIIQDSN